MRAPVRRLVTWATGGGGGLRGRARDGRTLAGAVASDAVSAPVGQYGSLDETAMSLFADAPAPSIVASDGVRPEPQLFTFRHDSSGKFVAAVAALKTGTTVFEEVGEVRSLPDKYTLQLDDGQHMLCAGPLIFCNHSCEPNCKAQVEYGLVRMVAIKQINAGDPITVT